jgi:hypothetical protein
MSGRYKGLLDDIKETQAGATPPTAEPPPSPALPEPELVAGSITPKPAAAKRKPGRPKVGKSSNPEFIQTTAYVEEAVHLAVRKALLDMKGTDYSSLVNELLKRWIKSRS